MHWYLHLLVHWLDLFRHFMCYAFAINDWITNGSEQVIALAIGALITYLIWPKLRHKVNAWVSGHFHAHQKVMKEQAQQHHEEHMAKLDAQHEEHMQKLDDHHEALKQHVADIITNNPTG